MEYSFDYKDKGVVSYVYLVGVGIATNAHIRFSYWAEYKISYGGYMGIALGAIVFFTILLLLLFTIVL